MNYLPTTNSPFFITVQDIEKVVKAKVMDLVIRIQKHLKLSSYNQLIKIEILQNFELLPIKIAKKTQDQKLWGL